MTDLLEPLTALLEYFIPIYYNRIVNICDQICEKGSSIDFTKFDDS